MKLKKYFLEWEIKKARHLPMPGAIVKKQFQD